MSLEYFDGTSKVPITKLEYWDGTQKVELTSLSYWDGDKKVVLYTSAAPLSINVDPALQDLTFSTSTYTSDLETATVTGGIPPYTYQWSVSHSGGGTVSITSPTNYRTTFKITGIQLEQSAVSDVQLTVSDSAGNSGTVSFSINWYRTNFQ